MERSASRRVRDALRGGLWNHRCPRAQTRAIGFKSRTFLMERVGDNDVVADGLHVERHVRGRQLFVHERVLRIAVASNGMLAKMRFGSVHQMEGTVINIYAAFGEVRCIEVRLAINECAGEAGVAGAVRGFDHGHSLGRWRRSSLSYCDGWVPPRDRSVNRREQEDSRFTGCQKEIGLAAVKDGAGWRAYRRVLVRRVGWRDCHN